jgi:hypothetical protein
MSGLSGARHPDAGAHGRAGSTLPLRREAVPEAVGAGKVAGDNLGHVLSGQAGVSLGT